VFSRQHGEIIYTEIDLFEINIGLQFLVPERHHKTGERIAGNQAQIVVIRFLVIKHALLAALEYAINIFTGEREIFGGFGYQ
jgi:hypothetical protein